MFAQSTYKCLYDIIAFDVATILMINFAKLHILTECYGDSAKDKRDSLTSREKHYMLERPPGFWDFTHYFMFCGTAALGPAYEYRDFLEFINLEKNYIQLRRNHNAHILPAFIRFAQGLLCLGLNVVLSLFISEKFILEDEFTERNIAYKSAYLIASMHLTITTMFAAFCLMEACLIASGQGFKPATEEHPAMFNSIRNVHIIKFETVTTVSESTWYWNSAS